MVGTIEGLTYYGTIEAIEGIEAPVTNEAIPCIRAKIYSPSINVPGYVWIAKNYGIVQAWSPNDQGQGVITALLREKNY